MKIAKVAWKTVGGLTQLWGMYGIVLGIMPYFGSDVGTEKYPGSDLPLANNVPETVLMLGLGVVFLCGQAHMFNTAIGSRLKRRMGGNRSGYVLALFVAYLVGTWVALQISQAMPSIEVAALSILLILYYAYALLGDLVFNPWKIITRRKKETLKMRAMAIVCVAIVLAVSMLANFEKG